MNRQKKMVFISYCILNVNSKVEGIALSESGLTELVYRLMKKGYGLIQLPCIEMECCGLKRWGQVEDQLNHPYFRNQCELRLKPFVTQAKAFLEQGYEIAGVIGLDGSPTCGVSETCSGNWSGEMGTQYNTQSKIDTLTHKKGPGVMMRIFQEMLKKENIIIPFYGIEENNKSIDIEKFCEKF